MFAYGLAAGCCVLLALVYGHERRVLALWPALPRYRYNLRLHAAVKRFSFCLSCGFLVVFSGIRYDVGTDYLPVYWLEFIICRDGLLRVGTVQMEWGMRLLYHALTSLSTSPMVFFLFTSGVIYVFLFLYLKDESPCFALSVLLLFLTGIYFSSLNIIRQFMVMAIGLYSFRYIHRGRRLAYFLTIGLLCLVHISAILLVPAYWAAKVRIDRRRALALLCATALLSPAVRVLMQAFMEHTRYQYYFTSRFFVQDADLSGSVYSLFMTVFAFIQYRAVTKGRQGTFYVNLLVLSDAVTLCSFFMPLVGRAALYYRAPSMLVLLPMLLKSVPRGKLRLVMTISVLLFFLASTAYLYGYRGLSGVNPYRTVFAGQALYGGGL